MLNLFFAGVFVSFKSFSLMFRNLKGLRRSQWAALMSVTFPVPLSVYTVDWRTPDGEPIEHRDEVTPVQGEPAYDPFALMDEQPESGFSTAKLQPTPVPKGDHHHGQWSAGCCGKRKELLYETAYIPKQIQEQMDIEQAEVIGCCGFPCFTGGMHGRLRQGDEQARNQPTIRRATHATATVVGRPTATQGFVSSVLRPVRDRNQTITVAENESRAETNTKREWQLAPSIITNGKWSAGSTIHVTKAFSCLRPGEHGKVTGMDKFGNVRATFKEWGALWIFARHLSCCEMVRDSSKTEVPAGGSAFDSGRKIVST